MAKKKWIDEIISFDISDLRDMHPGDLRRVIRFLKKNNLVTDRMKLRSIEWEIERSIQELKTNYEHQKRRNNERSNYSEA